MYVGTSFDSFEELVLALKEHCEFHSIVLCINKRENVTVANIILSLMIQIFDKEM